MKLEYCRELAAVTSRVTVIVLLSIALSSSCNNHISDKDGVLQIIYTGDSRGLLEPCGCGQERKGGFGRRIAFIKSCMSLDIPSKPKLINGDPIPFMDKSREKVLLLDAGSFLDLIDPVRAANAPIVLKLLKRTGYTALNLGRGEITGNTDSIIEFLGACDVSLVSSNATLKPKYRYLHKKISRYIQVSVAGRKVVITGLVADDSARVVNSDVFLISDPLSEIQKLLEETAIADAVMIVLVDGLSPSNIQQLKQLPGIDCLISGVYTTPAKDTFVTIPTAPGGTEVNLAVLELSGSRVGSAFSCSFELGEELKEDPVAAEVISHSVRLREIPGNATGSLAYVGNKECFTCHTKESSSWRETPHSGAMESLRNSNEDHNALCLQCHTVGALYNTGYIDTLQDDKEFVGCESCHGPGSEHIAKMCSDNVPSSIGDMVTSSSEMCVRCHNYTNSPGFKIDDALTRLSHP